jgi:hypothetical protein
MAKARKKKATKKVARKAPKRAARKAPKRKARKSTIRRYKGVPARLQALVAAMYGSSKKKRKAKKKKAGGKRKAGAKRKAAVGRCKHCKRAIFGGKKGMSTHLRRSH